MAALLAGIVNTATGKAYECKTLKIQRVQNSAKYNECKTLGQLGLVYV